MLVACIPILAACVASISRRVGNAITAQRGLKSSVAGVAEDLALAGASAGVKP